jgi:hypothetical protein
MVTSVLTHILSRFAFEHHVECEGHDCYEACVYFSLMRIALYFLLFFKWL